MALLLGVGTLPALAVTNLGDPLFCQPQEGTTYLIVNGGAGVFTADADCYGNNLANITATSIATTQGGLLTLTPGTGNYTYAPPTPNFTGLDTFQITVTTVWNSAGGTGSAGGTSRPGGPATLTVTLNVLPATMTLFAPANVTSLVPVPMGAVTGCSPVGNPGQGPLPGVVYGCVTAVVRGAVAPSNGTLVRSGNTLAYTPNGQTFVRDTFSIQVLGVNNDGSTALNSGEITVTTTNVPPPTPAPSTVILVFLGLAAVGAVHAMRNRQQSAA
jgi:hypothetical protein